MDFILNIGLATNDGGTITAMAAERAVRDSGFFVKQSRTHRSDTEATLVVECYPLGSRDGYINLVKDRLVELADTLRQDCVAAYVPSIGTGRLHGAKAADWGPFNPKLFLNIQGITLEAP
jgi:hypothetical protein